MDDDRSSSIGGDELRESRILHSNAYSTRLVGEWSEWR